MSSRNYKILLCLVAVLALTVNTFNQTSMNGKRERMGLTRIAPLENAPPVLAFTTVALGGFRGLIVNYLFIRSNQLQREGKYFETMTLGDWITKLQPTFTPVWRFQAWNMTYNISRTFEDPVDRFRWVWAGIKLLRDEGLKYNPTDTGMYWELGWFFLDKIGRFTDTTHFQYKRIFASMMHDMFPDGRPDYELWDNPQTDEEREIGIRLRESFKMESARVRKVDEFYGPFDWRLPEAHAIYWAEIGRENSTEGDIIEVYRVIWQAMQLAFQRGRININPHDGSVEFSKNLDIIDKVNRTYEQFKEYYPAKADYISRSQEMFIQDAIYFLYLNYDLQEAADWYKFYRESNIGIYDWVDEMPLDEFVMLRITMDVNTTGVYKVRTIIEAYLQNFYYFLALGDDKKAMGTAAFAKKIYRKYHDRMSEKSVEMHGYNSFESIQMSVLANSLTGNGRFNPTMSERLRIRLGMSKDWKKDLRPDVLRNIQVTKGLQDALRDATGKDGSKGDKAPQRNPGLNTVIDADETEAKK
ncbi:MAG: hypothetical protein ACI9OD_004102 [Limisphaerales bacterium]|jgi:hypothetical protein